MKKLLLADDHTIVRAGIKHLIEESVIQVLVDEASSGVEIIEKIKNNRYDLVILDVGMPNTDFNSLVQWLTVYTPDTNLLIFSMQPEEIYGTRCIQLGAKGYIRKTASNEEIITAITRVLNGEKYLSSNMIDLLSSANFENKAKNPFDSLSPRELEIVKHLNDGKSLPDICTIMNIQYSTANSFKRSIFEKLGVDSVLSLTRLMRSFDIQ